MATALDQPASANGPPARLSLDLDTDQPDRIIPSLIELAAQLHASDLFCHSDEDRVEFAVRHLGIVRLVGAVPAEVGRRCVSYIKTLSDMNATERRRPLDGRWLYTRRSGSRLDLRVSTLPTLHGEDCTIRILDQADRLLSLDQLGLDPVVYSQLAELLNTPSGLILVTGPTESGKSTTLYASLAHLNNGERKINTIEEPIEYSLPGIRQSQAGAGLGSDVLLRSVLRQAPDVIMIGEIREPETALTAVRAAATGHLVLATLHAPVAPAAVHSMLRLGVHPHLLSHSLLGVISQRLVRTLCPRCKEGYEFPAAATFAPVRRWLRPGDGDRLYGPRGCPACYSTGYAGRTGLFEMLRVTPEIRPLLDEAAPVATVRARALDDGMYEFRHSALLKVARGETSIEEVLRVLSVEYLAAPVVAG